MSRLFAGVRAAALIAAAAAMLLWPALVNGRPAVFTDTALYYSQAAYLMAALGVAPTPDAGLPQGDPTRLPDRPRAPNMSADIDGARSPVWGAMLYELQRAGGVWLAALAQALAAATAIYLVWRGALPRLPRWSYLALMAALAAATSLAVFATLMMPDVFAGVALVSLTGLLNLWPQLSVGRRTVLLILLAFSAACHGSIPLLAATIVLLGIGVLALSGLDLRRAAVRAGAALAAVGVGVAALHLAYAPIQQRAGEAIGAPPFLTARVLADGPGRSYLAHACRGDAPFEVCRFAGDRLDDSDMILWSAKRGRGVFSILSEPARRRMERQDIPFALAAITAAPLAEMVAAARDTGLQIAYSGVDDSLQDQSYFLRDRFWRRTSLARIIPNPQACVQPAACASHVPPMAFSAWEMTVSGVALALLVWRLSRPDLLAVWNRRDRPADPGHVTLARIAVLAVLSELVNAAICGALSGPFPRYQARVAWIVPLAAAVVLTGAGLAVPRWRARVYLVKATS